MVTRVPELKKIALLLFIIFTGNAYSQGFTVFDIDTTDFPVMKAKFYAFDEDGNQIRNLSPDDFEVFENGVKAEVLNVTCTEQVIPQAISSVLTIDISGSMKGQSLINAQSAARAWVNGLPLGKSECAITTFNHGNYFNQDFTTDRNKLINTINNLSAGGGTSFDAGFINMMAGAFIVTEKSKYKKVNIFVTDGYAKGNENLIIQRAQQLNTQVYCVTLTHTCPEILKKVAIETGGQWYEDVTTKEKAESVFKTILLESQNYYACEIEWKCDINCEAFKDLEFHCLPINSIYSCSYNISSDKIATLLFSPSSIIMKISASEIKRDTTIKITALNNDCEVIDITGSNPYFGVQPQSFILKKGQSRNLTLTFEPQDSSNHFCKFEVNSEPCPDFFYASGYIQGTSAKQKNLKIVHPNGGEKFLVANDTVISWDGILPSDTVSLDYSTNNGESWNTIINKISGLKYKWKNIPNSVSDSCLMRARKINFDYLWTTLNIFRTSVKYSPDGSLIAFPTKQGVTLINSSTLDTICKLSADVNNIRSLSWSPDGSKLAAGDWLGDLTIWDIQNQKKYLTIYAHNDGNRWIHSIDWSPNGKSIATGSGDKTIKIWKVADGTEIRTLTGHKDDVTSISWSPDGSKIASGSRDNYVKIWNAANGELLKSFKGHSEDVNSVSWSPNGNSIASASEDSTIKIWDIKSSQELKKLDNLTAQVYCVSWSPDGSSLVSGSYNGQITIWDAVSGMEKNTLYDNDNMVYSVDWSPDAERIVSSSIDGIKVWDAVEGYVLNALYSYSSSNVSWSPFGTEIAVKTENGIKFLDAENGQLINQIIYSDDLHCLSWSPDGNKIAAGLSSAIQIWDSKSKKELIYINSLGGNVVSLSWSPDGSKFVTTKDRERIRIFDANNGTIIDTLGEHTFLTNAIWSPDGKKIASIGYTTIKIWDADTGDELRTLSGHTETINSISWDPDGSRITSGSEDGKIIIWDADSGETINTLTGNIGEITCVNWSPNGAYIAAGNYNGIVKIWDAQSGEELITLCGHTLDYGSVSNVFGVDWNPYGTQVVTNGYDGTIKVWDINPELNSDISDSLWAIVAPSSASTDIDMGKVIFGESKDSVVNEFILNTGKWKYRVDSIYFTGADASAFGMVSGFPEYEVDAGGSYYGEFRFTPSRVGNHQAEIVIITQADTLIQNIYGEGVERKLEIYSDIINFGIIEIFGDTTISRQLITNISTESIAIDSTVMLGPDREQFNIITGGGSFVLAPDESRELEIMFKPKYIGRTSGQIGFYYNDIGSPAAAQLYGAGIGGGLCVSYDSAFAGQTRMIKVNLDGGELPKFSEIVKSFNCKLRFEKSILAPRDAGIIYKQTGDSIFIELTGNMITGNDCIAETELICGLGKVQETTIDIEEITWFDKSGNPIEYDSECQSGAFKLLGICNEGGRRLINPESTTGIISIKPNPAENVLNIEFSVIEEGYTEIGIFNVIGEKVKTIFAKDISSFGEKNIQTDISGLGSGQYMIIFKSPTWVESKRIVIVK